MQTYNDNLYSFRSKHTQAMSLVVPMFCDMEKYIHMKEEEDRTVEDILRQIIVEYPKAQSVAAELSVFIQNPQQFTIEQHEEEKRDDFEVVHSGNNSEHNQSSSPVKNPDQRQKQAIAGIKIRDLIANPSLVDLAKKMLELEIIKSNNKVEELRLELEMKRLSMFPPQVAASSNNSVQQQRADLAAPSSQHEEETPRQDPTFITAPLQEARSKKRKRTTDDIMEEMRNPYYQLPCLSLAVLDKRPEYFKDISLRTIFNIIVKVCQRRKVKVRTRYMAAPTDDPDVSKIALVYAHEKHLTSMLLNEVWHEVWKELRKSSNSETPRTTLDVEIDARHAIFNRPCISLAIWDRRPPHRNLTIREVFVMASNRWKNLMSNEVRFIKPAADDADQTPIMALYTVPEYAVRANTQHFWY